MLRHKHEPQRKPDRKFHDHPVHVHHARIDTIQEGDHVQTPNGYQPVIGRFHADAEVAMPYHVLWAEGMDVPMGISDDHWLYIDGIESDPATAKVGQTVSTPNGPRRITKIEYYRQRGAYHIIVPGGMYYVDGTSRPPCPRGSGT